VLLFLLTVGICGCATTTPVGHRFYFGPPRPNNEVALVYAVAGCSINDIRNESEKDLKKIAHDPPRELELLPGQYIAYVNFEQHHGIEITMEGGISQLRLSLQGGNIYIIYPEIEGRKEESKKFFKKAGETWRPIIVNISDYKREACRDSRYGLSCPSKDRILELATKYLQSERRIMTYHPPEVFLGIEQSGYWD